MTVPIQPVPDPRIVANLQRLKDAGAGEDVLNAYLAEEAAKPARPNVDMAKVRARQNANEADMADAQTPSYMESALGGIAALLKHVPGGEAAQAGARSLVRGQPYSQALSDIRGSEADNPASGFNGLVGGTVAAAAMPGNPVASGGLYGAANGALAPEGSLKDRAQSAAIQGTTGAIAGKVLPALFSYVGSKVTPTLGAQAVSRDAAMKTADDAAYGLAQRQGSAIPNGAAHPAVAAAFADKDIKPFVDLVKGSRSFAGADDATVLREAYKLMSREQGGLEKKLAEQGFDALTSTKARDIGLAKKQLLDAADTMMPALRDAIKQHAGLASEEGTMQQGADVANRVLNNARIGGKKLDIKSPEAFARDIKDMTPGEAQAALDGILGRMKEFRSGSFNPIKGFGLPGNVAKAAKLQPYIQMLQAKTGGGLLGQAGTNLGQAGMQGLFGP